MNPVQGWKNFQNFFTEISFLEISVIFKLFIFSEISNIESISWKLKFQDFKISWKLKFQDFKISWKMKFQNFKISWKLKFQNFKISWKLKFHDFKISWSFIFFLKTIFRIFFLVKY